MNVQLGDTLALALDTVDGSGNPVVPDASPTIGIVDSSSSVILATQKLGMADTSYKAFSLDLFVGGQFALGTYTVTFSWLVSGTTLTSTATFTVVGGGDLGGDIISMRAYVRPEATYVVAQATSGNILQGRNPRL